MKKLLFILMFLVCAISYGQTTVINGELKVTTVPTITTELDTLVFYGSDQKFKAVEYTDLVTKLNNDISGGGGVTNLNDQFAIGSAYTTALANRDMKGIVTSGNITLNDESPDALRVEYQITFLNNSGGDITVGVGGDDGVLNSQSVPVTLEDGYYAYCEIVAPDVWSIAVGSSSGGVVVESDPVYVSEKSTLVQTGNVSQNIDGIKDFTGAVSVSGNSDEAWDADLAASLGYLYDNYQPLTESGVAGEAVNVGQIVYQGTDTKWYLADADDLDHVSGRLGITTISAIADGNTGITRYVERGTTGATPGALLYLSNTPGGITETKPTTGYVRVVGTAKSATLQHLSVSTVNWVSADGSVLNGQAIGGSGTNLLPLNNVWTGTNYHESTVGVRNGNNNIGGTSSLWIGAGNGFTHSFAGTVGLLNLTIGSSSTPYKFTETPRDDFESVMRYKDVTTITKGFQDMIVDERDGEWTLGAGVTDQVDYFSASSSTSVSSLNISPSFLIGDFVKVGVSLLNVSAGSVTIQVEGTQGGLTMNANGYYELMVDPLTTSHNDFTITTSGFTGEIREFRVSGMSEYIGGGVGGGLDNVVEDTTPQLGGDLDVNGNQLTGDSGNNGLILDQSNYFKVWVDDVNSDQQYLEWQVSPDTSTKSRLSFRYNTADNSQDVGFDIVSDATTNQNDFELQNVYDFDFNAARAVNVNYDVISRSTTSTVALSWMGETVFQNSGSTTTITIPDTISAKPGAQFTVIAEGAGTVTIATSGSATINGSSSITIDIAGASGNVINGVNLIQKGDNTDDWIAIGNYTVN